jgi:hypothetical protein
LGWYRRSSCGLRRGVPVVGVAELGQHPGAEDRTQSRLGQDDLSGRVLAKMCLHLLGHGRDLLVQHGQDRDRGAHGGGISGHDDLGLAQVLSAQRGLDPPGLVRDVVSAGSLERGADLANGQPGRRRRVGCLGQQLQRIDGVQVVKRLQRAGKILPQRVPQPLAMAGALPDQGLVCPGHHLDRLRPRAVPGHRAQLVRVGTDHISEHVRIRGVAFGPGHPQPIPVAGRLQRIDREHGALCKTQRPAPRSCRRPARTAILDHFPRGFA